MGSNRKFKREYIILEAKDMNFRYKERILPKAFAKIEINDEKSVIALYVENLKYMKDGYRVVAIRSDYETIDLGKITLNEQGKGEFVLDLEDRNAEIKGIALLYEKTVPLIGFKGSKIENYEEILFMADEEEYTNIEDEGEYEEIEYIEVDEEDDDEYEEYEEIEYIEIDEEDDDEYMEIEEDNQEYDLNNYSDNNKYEVNYNNQYKQYENITNKESLVYNRTNKILNKNKVNKEKIKQRTYSNVNHNPFTDTEQSDEYQDIPYANNKTPGALLMPRQIKKGLKYFKEAKPFVNDYIENTRWWKIDITPTTLCGYTMPYLGYVNSLNFTMYSDAIMQSYKYRHYLFGVQYDEYNKRQNYIYAVPGKKDEQPDQGHTGFSVYQPCDYRNNNLGYWLCYIDSRSRQILK